MAKLKALFEIILNLGVHFLQLTLTYSMLLEGNMEKNETENFHQRKIGLLESIKDKIVKS